MSKQLRQGYDILAKRAIETESGINIDDALQANDIAITELTTNISQTIADIRSNFDCIYVSRAGSDTNDGLTKHTAVQTLAGAINAYIAAKTAGIFNANYRIYFCMLDSSVYALPTNEQISAAGLTSAGLYFVGTNVNIYNVPEGISSSDNAYLISYPIHITAENAWPIIKAAGGTIVNTTSITIDCDNVANGNDFSSSGTLKINATGSITISDSNYTDTHAKLDLTAGNTITIESGTKYYDYLRLVAENNIVINKYIYCQNRGSDQIYAESKKGNVSFGAPLDSYGSDVTIIAGKNITQTAGLTANDVKFIADGQITFGGSNNTYGSFYAKCNTFTAVLGAHQYMGNFTVDADYFNHDGDGVSMTMYRKATVNAKKSLIFPNIIYSNNIEVNSTAARNDFYCIYCCSDPAALPIKENSKYVFNLGSGDTYFSYAGLENQFADVTMNSTGKIYLTQNATSYCKSLKLTANYLNLSSEVQVGSFDINVAGILEQQPVSTACIWMRTDFGTFGESDYVDYDIPVNSYLKAGTLYCSVKYSAPGYGLLATSYKNAIKNIDIQIDALLCPDYYTTGAGGLMSPFVLNECRSGTSTFNSMITGHVGGFIFRNNVHNISSWDHDIRRIPASYGTSNNYVSPVVTDGNNTAGVISIKYDNICEARHFWFDPDQGDDRLDGCTRKTAVKTAAGLIRAMMRKCGGYYDSISNTIDLTTCPVSVHILSVSGGNRNTVFGANNEYSDNLYQMHSAFTNLQHLDFTSMAYYGGCKVQMGFIEFVPEAPDVTLMVRGLSCNMLTARGFYNIGLAGCSCSAIADIEAKLMIALWNSSYYGSTAFYMNDFCSGRTYMKAYDIFLYGIFRNLNADAENNFYLFDTYGGSESTVVNCCLKDQCTITARNVYLGGRLKTNSDYYQYQSIGLSGGTIDITATESIHCKIDSFVNCVCHMNAGESVTGNIGSGYFKGSLYIKCKNFTPYYDSNFGSSFSTYNATNNAVGAGVISIDAANRINIQAIGTSADYGDCYLYGVDLYLKAPFITGYNLYIYGNNGTGKVEIDAKELYAKIALYYYNYFFVKADHCSTPIELMSGGPWGPTDGASHYCYVSLDINIMRSSIYVSTSSMSSDVYWEVTGRIGRINSKVLYWGQTIDPSNPPTVYANYNFAITICHSMLSGHGIDLTEWIPSGVGEILVLNDSKPIVAGQGISVVDNTNDVQIVATGIVRKSTVTGALDANNTYTATVPFRQYSVIEVPSNAIAFVVDVPVAVANELDEASFSFTTLGNNVALFEVHQNGYILPIIGTVPATLSNQKRYQCTIIDGVVTFVEVNMPTPIT